MPAPSTDPEPNRQLHEREVELERIASAVEAAGTGSGGLLLIRGPAGIGKTALLDSARRIAADECLAVLSARASEIEHELAFGIVRQLLEPLVRGSDRARREALLDGSAALAASALGLAEEPPAPDAGAATLHGIFWLLSNLADEGPLLLAIDDAHWADPASARLLGFLAPRLEGIGCLAVVTARPEGPADLPLAATASDPASHALAPQALSSGACAAILGDCFAGAIDPAFAEACHSVSGGNPYYLRSLIGVLIGDGVRPTADSASAVRAVNPGAVSQAVLARLATFGAGASAFAGALAALGGEADLGAAGALAGLDPGEAAAAVENLERSGIVAVGERVGFAHAILGNAVHADLGRARRSELHRRIADGLRSQGADAEEVAAHVIQMPPEGDERALSTLRAAAVEAVNRGAPDSAVAYLRRALSEPPPEVKRAGVLLQLGVAETATDLGSALEHLRQALPLAPDRGRRLLTSAVLARVLFFAARMREAVRVGRDALEDVEPGEDELRRQFEALVLAAASLEPAERAVAEELADELRASGIDGEDLGAKALASALLHLEARGARLSAADAAWGAERVLEGDVLLREDNGRAAFCAAALVLTCADSDRALPVLEAGAAAAVARGDLLALAGNRTFASFAHLVRGELADAVSSGEEGLDHSEAHGAAIGLPWAGAFLASAQIERGELEAAEAALARAHGGSEVPENASWDAFLASRAQLLAARGEPRDALELALECGRRFEAVGGRTPAFLAWRSRAALSLTTLGEEPARAAELASEEVAMAREWGAPRTLGAALAVQGVLTEGEPGVERLREAVGVLDGSPARLELARARVELGARLRRDGRRAEAREPLAAGLELARACGALPLAERAYEELRATGARPRKILLTGVDSLTPSELRVARLAAEGSSNREIAQRLFVTQKTVEWHLGHVYTKLDLSSRAELPKALRGGADPAA